MTALREEVNNVKAKVSENIELQLENLDVAASLEETTRLTKDGASQFQKTATKTKNRECWKAFKLQLIIAGIVICAALIIIISVTSG